MNDSKLYDYQQEIVDSDEEEIICNWARPLGKTFTLINKIISNRLNKIVWIGDFNNLKTKISEVIKMDKDLNRQIGFFFMQDKITIIFYSNCEINIYNYNNSSKLFSNEEQVDLLVFDGILPYKIKDFKAKQIISMITINNYDKKLQKLFPYIKIREQGIDTALKYHLINKVILGNLKKQNINTYYNEIDILSMPENLGEKTKNDRLEELMLGYKVEPHNIFLIQTLAKLQREYDAINPNEDEISRKREPLMRMIINVRRELSTQVNLQDSQNNSYNFEFNVDKLQATEEEANSFAKRIIGKVKKEKNLNHAHNK